MEIAVVGNSLRIKGKQVTLLVGNPNEKIKNPVDALLLLGNESTKTLFSDMYGVAFQAPGEYEVKGAKITGFSAESDVMYTVSLDGLSVFIGKISSSLKAKDRLHEHDIAVLQSDETLSQAALGFLNPRGIVFYGTKATENLKAFGKDIPAASKYLVTKDKLPQETEFVLLA